MRRKKEKMNSICHRVSIRKYQDRPVGKEKIIAILRAAMQAPSAANQQPWEFFVVTNPETLKELAATSPFGYPAEERKQQNRFDESRIHWLS